MEKINDNLSLLHTIVNTTIIHQLADIDCVKNIKMETVSLYNYAKDAYTDTPFAESLACIIANAITLGKKIKQLEEL